MRPLVSLVLAVSALVPACTDPAPATEDETSSSSGGDETSSGSSEESSTTGCDVSEFGWCAETCIVPTGIEVGTEFGDRNLCDIVSHVVVMATQYTSPYPGALGCGNLSCWKAVAEVYGGGVFTLEDGTQMELWELSKLRFEAGWTSTCGTLPAPSCEILSYEDCMETTRVLDGPEDEEFRDLVCHGIATRYPAAGLPPSDWPG